MHRPKITIIDYGLGNLLSVRRGFEYCGADVEITSDPSLILQASRIVLPGVGAFANGMAELKKLNLDIVLREAVYRGKALLGICLGMQMLLDESEEFGLTAGLGFISGRVKSIPLSTKEGQPQKIPHIGWNSLFLPPFRESWEQTLLHDVKLGDSVYFVHSFMAEPFDPFNIGAVFNYGNIDIPAVIWKENILGCQFHPEKSGKVGLNILKNFLTF